MADTAISITQGSGTSIDTRTEGTNGNHRQVVVLGDPATNAGVAPVDATAGLKVDLGADNDVVISSGTITAVTAITNALPAGTNAIGKLAANSGVDIGDVDVISCALPTGASTAAKQDTGNTSLSSIDGKITACNTGAVVVSSSALPSGASTAAKQPALGTAGTASADVITVQGIASMTALKVDGSAVTQPISAASLPLPTSAATSTKQSDGSQKTQIVDGSGNVIGSTSNALNVNVSSGTVTVDTTGLATSAKQDTQTTSLQLIDDPVATTGSAIPTKGFAVSGTDGTNARVLKTDSSGELQVDVLTMPTVTVNSHAVTNAGTFATQESGALLTSAQLLDDAVATTGSAITAKGYTVCGTDGTNARALKTDTSGELQVDVLTLPNVTIGSALPAGTNGIGKLTSNSGVTIGAVEIASSQTLSTVTTVSTVTNQSQEGGVNISLNAGAVDTGTRRVVQANGAGKTILSAGGSASSSGNNTLIAAGTNKLKVKAFSLTTTSTTAMTCIFQSGASGTELWRVVIQAPSGASAGANLSTSAPDWLFATASATLLNLNLSSANAVHWSVSYYDEA